MITGDIETLAIGGYKTDIFTVEYTVYKVGLGRHEGVYEAEGWTVRDGSAVALLLRRSLFSALEYDNTEWRVQTKFLK